jgi:hypothetical protein
MSITVVWSGKGEYDDVRQAISACPTRSILLTVAIEAFDCGHALVLLSEAVTEYRPSVELRGHVWTRGQRAAFGDDKIADLTAKRRQSEQTGRPSTPGWQPEPPSVADTPA